MLVYTSLPLERLGEEGAVELLHQRLRLLVEEEAAGAVP